MFHERLLGAGAINVGPVAHMPVREVCRVGVEIIQAQFAQAAAQPLADRPTDLAETGPA
jgi:hypothetical protein